MEHIIQYLVQFLKWYYIVNRDKLDEHYGMEQDPKNPGQPNLVTQQKAARIIGISVRQVRRLTVDGVLPCYQNIRGREIRYEYAIVVEICRKFYKRNPIED
jgi:hypothetical protein